MSFRTFQRVTLMSLLALGAFSASACKDDKKTDDKTDAGGGGKKDAGTEPVVDSGTASEDAGVEGIVCGDNVCLKSKQGSQDSPPVLGQCCAGEAMDVCGTDLKPPTPGAESLGCFPQDPPGVASASCGVVLDAFETDGTVEGKFEINAGGISLALSPCCTAQGTCGVDTTKVTPYGDLGLGCLDAVSLQPATSSDAGGGFELQFEKNGVLPILPNTFCVPETGETGCIPSTFMGQPVPPFVLNACPAVVKDGCIVGVEQNIKGCGVDDKWEGAERDDIRNICVNNVAATVFGCDPLSAATLARLPEYACGCGEGEVGNGRCLANTAPATCGTIAVTADVPGLPGNACGCGDAKLFTGAGPFCLSNVPVDVCGADAVATMDKPDSDPVVKCVPQYPEYMTGCGADTAPTTYPSQCIPHVAATVYGCEEVTKASTTFLAPLPNGACGCGENTFNTVPPGPGFCLSYAATDACGLTAACTEATACTPDGGAADSGVCLDTTGTGGTVEGSNGQGGSTTGDDIGDYCFAPPPPT